MAALFVPCAPGEQRLAAIEKALNAKVMVSLSCTMCPEVVMATQRVASLSEHVRAEMVDLRHYPKQKQKYNIMSGPCMVVNGSQVYFGKKNLEEAVELLEKA